MQCMTVAACSCLGEPGFLMQVVACCSMVVALLGLGFRVVAWLLRCCNCRWNVLFLQTLNPKPAGSCLRRDFREHLGVETLPDTGCSGYGPEQTPFATFFLAGATHPLQKITHTHKYLFRASPP